MQTDLFGTGATGVYDPNFVGELQQLGTIRQGDAYRGKYIRIELPKGVMVDIFTAASSNYGLIKMYRTGSREWLQAVMLARLAANGYRSVDGHLYKMVPQNMTTLERDTIQEPALVRYDTPTEKEVFAAMGMAYVQAPDRECKPVIKIKK
jgi:DNA polymerase/3'-5' exonuclease PolX